MLVETKIESRADVVLRLLGVKTGNSVLLHHVCYKNLVMSVASSRGWIVSADMGVHCFVYGLCKTDRYLVLLILIIMAVKQKQNLHLDFDLDIKYIQ